MTSLNYTKTGDYQIPSLTLSDTPQIGRYGRLRRDYLKNHRPILYNRLILSEKLYPHLVEIDQTANRRMEQLMNELTANGVTRGDLKILIQLLNPFAPHITEELWESLGFAAQTGKMCCQSTWPVCDESKTVSKTVEMAIQVNGKMKGTVTMPADSAEADVVAAALAVDKVKKATGGMQIVKTILVKNRLVNLIVKPC